MQEKKLNLEEMARVSGGIWDPNAPAGEELSGIFKYVTDKERNRLTRLSNRYASATTDEGVTKAYKNYCDYVDELNKKYEAQLSGDIHGSTGE